MSKQFLIFLGIGIVIVAIIIGGTLFTQRGAHLTLEGKILKVRTMPSDEKSAIVVVDFRVTNGAKTPFMVKDAIVKIIGADGSEVEGATIARSDMDRISMPIS